MSHDFYYNDGYGAAPRRRSLLLWLLDGAVAVASALLAVLMVVVFAVPRLHPVYTWALPVLGLVAPAIYVATVLAALYWILRWRLKRAAVVLVPVLLGAFSVSLFWRPEVRRSYPTERYPRSTIRCMSYNVRNLYSDGGGSNADRIAALIEELAPEIVCLQEYAHHVAVRSERFMRLFDRYETAHFGLPGGGLPAQAILSKYRILRSGVITTPESSVWADLLVGEDTVRVVNNHLQSTGITALDNAYITRYEYLADTAREEKLRSIVGRIHRNCELRADQVDSIRAHIDSLAPRYRIVCGDFNDTPVSYTYRRMARDLNDAFSECGHGYSHTFRGFFNALRIDYILSSDDFETLSYEVPDTLTASDHLPLFVRLKKRLTYN